MTKSIQSLHEQKNNFCHRGHRDHREKAFFFASFAVLLFLWANTRFAPTIISVSIRVHLWFHSFCFSLRSSRLCGLIVSLGDPPGSPLQSLCAAGCGAILPFSPCSRLFPVRPVVSFVSCFFTSPQLFLIPYERRLRPKTGFLVK